MGRRDDRQKASEVFAKSDYVFAQKVGFAQAFPQIRSLKVTVSETGHVGYGGERSHYRTETSAGEYIDCSNPLCYNGGISLGNRLREMVRDGKTELEFTDICKGSEGSAKGRRIYRKCLNFFRGRIDIEYQEKSDPPVRNP